MSGLESATYINQLNPLNPDGSIDFVSTADDHIRLVKSTIQNTFTRVTGATTASHDDLSSTTYLTDTGTANAIVVTPSPAWTAYSAGKGFTFKAAYSNTGATTIKVNSLATISVVGQDGTAVPAGTIIAGGVYTVRFDGTSFKLLSHGNTRFKGNEINVTPASGTDVTIKNTSTGSIYLNTNGGSSFRVTSTGVAITGTASVSSTATFNGSAAFNGSTSFASKPTISGAGSIDTFPSGTRMLFAQSSAPTGWTLDTSLDGRALFIWSANPSTATGGATTATQQATYGNWYGGSHTPVYNPYVATHNHSASSSVSDPGHSHSYTYAYSAGNQKPASGGTAPYDSSAAANTSVSGTGITVSTTVSNNSGTNFTPKYATAILAVKN
ncbi:hypothetical protein [Methylobacter sp.]|uniref:hypothetical protein n=1 Tax=Methylobacter sp. TaxID=2051955 RepID=UPI003DA642F0